MLYQPGPPPEPDNLHPYVVEEFRRIADAMGLTYDEGAFPPPKLPVTDTTYQVLPTDSVILIDATSNSVAITHVPLAAAQGRTMRFKRIDNVPANTVTVDGSGAETIDGDLTFSLFPYEDVPTFAGGSSDWSVL